MLDLHTFGNSKGAEHLVHKLNELNDSRVTRNVTNFLTKRYQLVSALEEMPDRAARLTFATMLKDSINISVIKDAPELIVTLSRNVAISAVKARIFCEPEYDGSDYRVKSVGEEFRFDDMYMQQWPTS
jgi:hypothetical protein